MVTEKDIINMGRKIKRSNNPKTLARYQAQIDAWIAELAQDQARTQTNILALEEKIKMEQEAREAQIRKPINSVAAPESPTESKRVAVKIAEQMIPLEEKIKLEEEAREAQISNLKQGDKIPVSAPESPTGESKKVAVKIAEKAGVSPRTV